jgi:hypothetical protein
MLQAVITDNDIDRKLTEQKPHCPIPVRVYYERAVKRQRKCLGLVSTLVGTDVVVNGKGVMMAAPAITTRDNATSHPFALQVGNQCLYGR